MNTEIKYDTLQDLHNLASRYTWQKSLEVFDTDRAYLIDLATYSEEPVAAFNGGVELLDNIGIDLDEPVIIVDPGNGIPYMFSFADRYEALALLQQ